MKWQPIETAPKDGTEVLVCGGDMDDMWCEQGKVVIASYDDWLFHSWTTTGGREDPLKPSYWMPLPVSPIK